MQKQQRVVVTRLHWPVWVTLTHLQAVQRLAWRSWARVHWWHRLVAPAWDEHGVPPEWVANMIYKCIQNLLQHKPTSLSRKLPKGTLIMEPGLGCYAMVAPRHVHVVPGPKWRSESFPSRSTGEIQVSCNSAQTDKIAILLGYLSAVCGCLCCACVSPLT